MMMQQQQHDQHEEDDSISSFTLLLQSLENDSDHQKKNHEVANHEDDQLGRAVTQALPNGKNRVVDTRPTLLVGTLPTNSFLTSFTNPCTTTTTTTTCSNGGGLFDCCYGSSGRRSPHREDLLPTMPRQDPTEQDVDVILANDMNQLSVTEREDILSDVHCVGNDNEKVGLQIEGNPMLMKGLLQQMEEELQIIGKYTAYEMALEQSPQYVRDHQFCVLFLRSEFYVPSKAANRMVRFLEEKLILFGKEKLTKNIYIR